MNTFRRLSYAVSSALLIVLLLASSVSAQEAEIAWTEGPSLVDMGDDLAQVNLGEEFLFTGKEDTQRIMESLGNTISGQEVGLIVPKSEKESWFVVFEYDPIGYIPDDEADTLDADAILQSIKDGTEEANKERAKNGGNELHVLGWQEAPHYDSKTNNLVWTILAESENTDGQKEKLVNHNVRVLGRTGYMSVVLVTDPETLSSLHPKLDAILTNFSYKTGKRYSEYVQGDKLAEIGMTALVAGGVGAAAAKTGLLKGLFKLLAAGGKAIIVMIIVAFAAISRFLKGLFSGRKQETDMPDQVQIER